MVRCTACGTECPSGTKFCGECGARLAPAACSACGTTLAPGVKFCGECGAPVAAGAAREPMAAPVASRRVTSVLFGDLVGFTTLSESRDQEEVRELLGRYFDECRTIVGHYGGTVEKFIGDAVMAVWGVPTAYEDDAERAVRAGLEMTARVAALGSDLRLDGLAMRVGVVTGEVAVTVGATGQGMVAGDPVNTAARVQSVAGPGQVWVDETTRLLTSSSISYVDAGSHALKGKAEPVPLWSVRAVVAASGGAQRADGLEAPLVGRDRELRLLKEHFHATLESGRPQLTLVSSEPGVGKSRLGWEFFKYVDGLSTTVRWNEGRCLAYGEGVAYSALADIVRARLRVPLEEDDGDPGPERLLSDGLSAYVPDADERAWLRPRLATLLGVPGGDAFAREDLFTAWTAFFERVAADSSGLVLVLDDAQYADDGLVLFLEHLLATASFPCFVLALARPALLEAQPGLPANRRVTVLHLDTLSAADLALLVEGLVAGVPDPVRDGLVARADGVPLFAVETVRSLIDRDLVVPRGGQYVLATEDVDLDGIGAPASLQALVSARLDTLSSEQRRVVEMGSVLGTTFRRDELAVLCPGVDLDEALPALVRTQILDVESSRLSAEHGHFRFVQDVVRQVAYGSLSRRDRRAAHLAVVALLEQDAREEIAPILAQHYLDAADSLPDADDAEQLTRLAVEHLRRAATRAGSLGATGEAVAHLKVALRHAGEGRETAEVQSALAEALFAVGSSAEAITLAVAAGEHFEEVGDPVAAGYAASLHALLLNNQLNASDGLTIALPHWERLKGRDDADATLLRLGTAIHYAQRSLGLDTRDVVEEMLRISLVTGGNDLVIGLQALCTYFIGRDLTPLAAPLSGMAVEVARSTGRTDTLARALVNKVILDMTEHLPTALRTAEEGSAASRLGGFASLRAVALINTMTVRFNLGAWDELPRADDEELVELGEQYEFLGPMAGCVRGLVDRASGRPVVAPWPDEPPVIDEDETMAWVRMCEALLAQDAGQDERAVTLAVESCRLISVLGLGDDFPFLFAAACEVVVAAGSGHEALLELIGSRRMLLPRALRGHRAWLQGAWELHAGRPVEAELALREALEHHRAWESPVHVARSESLLAVALHQQGRVEEAAEAAASAGVVLDRLGATAWASELDPAVLGGVAR
ncbi:adenylate/guanylate cyclase domain-containing protein [Nocardioides marmoribigeumensis]|uniref:Class 3 adenylate cyclase/tetratricopeptide (TPR) repeat protein n=1 Tax=Nocardioides marmoribigeumensis TaxID=433649 RepID=A0ABU2BX43_9ACTN|nr:adenylate/guanylate cyclase domain-containing protein [Nocardioides marmoribigeumensis]MDR7362974.1 class 3 adenylate cyclase/tetratricopeptide (TPR) repeat protein [Nocardioides marmoribigeumensis]